MNALAIAEQFAKRANGRELLLVEDNQDDAYFATRELNKLNCRVTHVTDAEKAIKLVEITAFEMALVDLKLPGMCGVELAKKLRDKGVCVVILSGSTFGTYINEAVAAGFVVLPKPFSLKDVSEIAHGFGVNDRRLALAATF